MRVDLGASNIRWHRELTNVAVSSMSFVVWSASMVEKKVGDSFCCDRSCLSHLDLSGGSEGDRVAVVESCNSEGDRPCPRNVEEEAEEVDSRVRAPVGSWVHSLFVDLAARRLCNPRRISRILVGRVRRTCDENGRG